MKIGLVGLPGCGKSTVFGALTGIAVKTGYESRSGKAMALPLESRANCTSTWRGRSRYFSK